MRGFRNAVLMTAVAGVAVAGSLVASRVDRAPTTATRLAPSIDLDRIGASEFPVIACFAPNQPVPERYAAAIEAMFHEAMLRYNGVTSWTNQGVGRTLTWSFVPDGLTIPSGVGEPTSDSNLFATLDSQFNGDRARWIGRFEQSFQRWADVTGMDYVRITTGGNDWDDGAFWGASGNANRGDVRIAMKLIGTSVLAYNSFPTNSDMVMDSADLWNSPNEDRLFRNTIMHEHGHGLGFAHICPQAGRSLMEPSLNTGFDGVQHDEVRGGQRLYGDPNEPDNSMGAATDLGVIAAGASVFLGDMPEQPAPGMPQPVFTSNLSIDANNEVDFFRFEIDAPSIVTFEINPVGRRYDDSDQGQSCGSGNQIDSDEIADLAFEILDGSGQSVATSDAAGLGESEIISELLLESAGVFYLRVYETNAPSESQLYDGAIAVLQAAECLETTACDDLDPCTFDACDNGRCVYTFDNDCNGNGRDDACEIAAGDALDCNMNGIPDSCDIDTSTFSAASPQLSPIGSGSPQLHTFTDAPAADTDVELAFEALGDINHPTENIEVFLDGVSAGFVLDGPVGSMDCLDVLTDTLVVPAAAWNAARTSGAGDVMVDLVASGSVNASACLPGLINYVQVTASFERAPIDTDFNLNNVPDSCEEINACSVADITSDGVCMPGDADGAVNLSDFSCYLSEWTSASASADITDAGACSPGSGGDGVDLSDFSCYLSEWSLGCP